MKRPTPQPLDLLTVQVDRGVTLVEASAGTGKTHCLTHLALKLLLQGAVTDISRLLVVTFTNAATAELVGRIRERLRDTIAVLSGSPEAARVADAEFLRRFAAPHGAQGPERLRRALRDFDQASVCTIHSFCETVLKRSAFESGMPFQAEFLDAENELLDEAAADFWRRTCCAQTLPAALAAAERLDLAEHLEVYREFRRAPGEAVLLPQAPPLEAAIRAAEQALERTRGAWNAREVAAIAEKTAWKKDAPFSEESRADTLARLQAALEGDVARGLTALLDCAEERVAEARNKTKSRTPPTHPFFAACALFAAAVETLQHSFLAEFIRAVDQAFDGAKRRRHVLTFDDLLRRLDRALRDKSTGARLAAAVKLRYEAALIDEFQDTDPIQCDIFMTALAGRPLVMVGDPKQAIYRFRGADIHAYLAARDKADRVYTLLENHRSESGMVRAVNALFGRARRPFLFEEIEFRDITPAGRVDAAPLSGDGRAPLQWWFVPGGDRKPLSKEDAEKVILPALSAEVARLLGGGLRVGAKALRAGDIAVLVRTNEHARAVQDRLRRAGIPCVVSGEASVIESSEMGELELILRAIYDPQDLSAVRAALATEAWGLDAAAIRRLAENDTEAQRRVETLNALREVWQREGFMPMVERFLTEEGVRARLLAFEDGERRLTNLLHAAETLHHAAEEERLTPEGLFKWLARARARGLPDPELAELRLESDTEAVQIVTVHKSKGLQYGVVFCPFLWAARESKSDRTFSVREDGRTVCFGPNSSPEKERYLALAEVERMAEELRLAYVAVTRARHRCYLVWGQLGRDAADSSALTYLLEQPEAASEGAFDWVEAVKEHAKARRADWRGDLEAFVEAGRGLMEARELTGEETAPRPRPAREEGPELAPRLFAAGPAALTTWVMTSYTGLVMGRHQREEPDHADPVARTAASRGEGFLAFGQGPAARGRAAEVGVCLHELLERFDFSRPGGELEDEALRETLQRYDLLRPEAHAARIDPVGVLRGLLDRVAAAELPGAGHSLARVTPDRRAAEWAFYLPLAPLAPRDLAPLFARHAAGALRRNYPPRLAELSARALHGYVNGFVDLVFEQDGRWGLIDWKSNHLGADPAGYAADALVEPMCEAHYVLQYHLYCAALHRHLRARLPGYDYDRCFAGAWYFFLRGLDGTGGGIWHDRPPRALIEALSALFDRRAAP
jgi:exodeoxyribonuclease V beta subunit